VAEHLYPGGQDLSENEWRERILLCFEALRSQQAPLFLETLEGVLVEGRIESLDPLKGRMVVSVPQAPSAGMGADDDVRLSFRMRESRWGGLARVHYHNDRRNRFTVILPKRLDPGERRREPRLLLDASENIKAVFVPAGSHHLRVTGRLSSLSAGGLRLAVEEAVDTALRRDVDPCALALEEHQILDSVLILGLRDEPLEVQGIVLEVDPQPLGPVLAVRFRTLPPEDLAFLQGVIAERTRARPAAASPEPQGGPEPSAGPELQMPPPDQADPRVKRFRTLALVMPQGQEREALRTFLATRGFTRVLPAGTLPEVAAMARKSPPDTFLVDWPDAAAPELDIALFLGRHPFPSPPRIILACTHATPQLMREANRLGVSHVLVKPYALDEAFENLLLQHLGGE